MKPSTALPRSPHPPEPDDRSLMLLEQKPSSAHPGMAVFRALSNEKSRAIRSKPRQIHRFQTRPHPRSAQVLTSVSYFDAPQSAPNGHFPVIAVTYPGQNPMETGFVLGETWSILSCAQPNVLILFYFQSSATACQHEAKLFYVMPIPVRDRSVPVR